MRSRNKSLPPGAHPAEVVKDMRRLRMGADLSQSDMAKIIGVHQQAIGLWERGRTQPPVNRHDTITAALGWISTMIPQVESDKFTPQPAVSPVQKESARPPVKYAGGDSLAVAAHSLLRLERSRGWSHTAVARLVFKTFSIGSLMHVEGQTAKSLARETGRQRIVELIESDPFAPDTDILTKGMSLMIGAYTDVEAIAPELGPERHMMEELSRYYGILALPGPDRPKPLFDERFAADVLEGAGF